MELEHLACLLRGLFAAHAATKNHDAAPFQRFRTCRCRKWRAPAAKHAHHSAPILFFCLLIHGLILPAKRTQVIKREPDSTTCLRAHPAPNLFIPFFNTSVTFEAPFRHQGAPWAMYSLRVLAQLGYYHLPSIALASRPAAGRTRNSFLSRWK